MKKSILSLALAALVISGCAPAAAPTPAPRPTETSTSVPPQPTATASPLPAPTDTLTPVPTATLGTTMFSQVTFSQDIICRMGPDEHYNPVVTYKSGDSAEVNGRNEDSSWLLVVVTAKNKDPYCWIPVTSLQKVENLDSLKISPYGALPDAPLSLTATSGVCGTTTSPMILEWSPIASGVGYRIYRNGKNIGSVYDDRFRDFDTPRANKAYVYNYYVQAFNAYGVSIHVASVSATLCGK